MRTLARLGFLAVLFGAGGCGNGQELVVVTVHGDRTGVAALEVLVELNGQKAMMLESFAADTSDFGLQLPAGAQGKLTVIVAGIDGNSCIVTIASEDAPVMGSGRIDVTVTLSPVSPPKC
jgi:hypothetical protein